jgi:hypothetical protein
LEHFGDGQAGDTKRVERFFHGVEFCWGDDGGDEFHGHPFSELG